MLITSNADNGVKPAALKNQVIRAMDSKLNRFFIRMKTLEINPNERQLIEILIKRADNLIAKSECLENMAFFSKKAKNASKRAAECLLQAILLYKDLQQGKYTSEEMDYLAKLHEKAALQFERCGKFERAAFQRKGAATSYLSLKKYHDAIENLGMAFDDMNEAAAQTKNPKTKQILESLAMQFRSAANTVAGDLFEDMSIKSAITNPAIAAWQAQKSAQYYVHGGCPKVAILMFYQAEKYYNEAMAKVSQLSPEHRYFTLKASDCRIDANRLKAQVNMI